MSNYLAIATVTAALQQLLHDPVNTAVSGATVHFHRPSENNHAKDKTFVNVYLYQVTPNANFRNADLPTRRSDSTLVRKPLTALDLHYLFTFHGKDDQLEPQRMLGAVANTLNSQPLLSAQNIQAAETAFGFLATSGLENQVERVRFTPTSLSLEEFSKLWSAFFQVEYSLSIAYQASVVLIESDDTPQPALPVQARNVYVMPFHQPVVSRVFSQAGAGQPIFQTSTLVIQGSHLLGDATTVRIGNLVVTPPVITDEAITMPIPAGLQAGVLGLQVIQQLQIGTPPQPHPGFESNVVALVLQPVIVPVSATSALVTVTVTPDVLPGQRVTLLLNLTPSASSATPTAYTFTLGPRTTPTNSLGFDIVNVVGGGTQYFVRVTIDGAESPLNLDPRSTSFGPTVTIP
jgi:Pvc16 N-terminal domain